MEKYVTLDDYREMWRKMQDILKTSGTGGSTRAHCVVDGIQLPPGIDGVVADLKTFGVRDDDVWVVTYPKAGTTWVQEIVSCVMHDGDLEAVNKIHTAFRVPFLELSLPEPIRRMKNLPPTHKVVEEVPSPRVIKSHLPPKLLPPELFQKKPKIVYVIRNPKDLTVSFYHFSKMVNTSPESLAEPFEKFFEQTMIGNVNYGPWWDHYLYFWKRRHEPNILLLRFEDMKKDLRGTVEKVSQFLGKNLAAEKLDAVTEHCTFANMKKNPMANQDSLFTRPVDLPTGDKVSFMRKGKVGDWKSHFTVAQNEAMDALIKEKLHGTGLTFDYD